MIIRRMRASYGMLDGRELRLQPGLNVITGGNETGKSTWLAFILSMLYGVDTKDRARRDRLPDKLKYLPWNGMPMSGTMELEADGRALTLERGSTTAPMGDFRAWDTNSGSPIGELTGKSCGQALLGVEAAVYARCGMIRQQHMPVSSDPQLEKRLSGLVSSGSEDYSYAEIDEKLKKLQTAIRHNQSGALPRAEEERRSLDLRLRELEESRRRLAELEADLHELRRRRDECREILAGLDALERRERQARVERAEAELREAREDRESWEAVCADLPEASVLQELETALRQLQSDVQRVALEDGLNAPEPADPGPDPLFGRMSAQEARDRAAADAELVRQAQAAKRPLPGTSPFWLVLLLLGVGAGVAGALIPQLALLIGGIVLALAGTIWRILLLVDCKRRNEEYESLQRQAKTILERCEAETAKDVLLRADDYCKRLYARENAGQHRTREALETLAGRRDRILARVDALMPGTGTPEKAAALFQEAARSRQALERARLLEQARSERLRMLRDSPETSAEKIENPERFAGYDRESVSLTLRALEERIEAAASKADMLSGAIGQMGEPLALEARREELDRRIQALEDRWAALQLARQALADADESLRSRFAPLLCEKTGELFFRLSGGRYDKVRLDRDLRVTVHPTDSAVFRPLSYLSGGAADQLYLALRLAICELLIPRAPILLDDALVYFDDQRAALALETLKELSKTRQVLIFSCQSREKRILDELASKQKADPEARPETVS